MDDSTPGTSHSPKSQYLGIYYIQCSTYGRVYKNKAGTAYSGHCPKCMKPIHIKIGSGGTSQRLFKAFCR